MVHTALIVIIGPKVAGSSPAVVPWCTLYPLDKALNLHCPSPSAATGYQHTLEVNLWWLVYQGQSMTFIHLAPTLCTFMARRRILLYCINFMFSSLINVQTYLNKFIVGFSSAGPSSSDIPMLGVNLGRPYYLFGRPSANNFTLYIIIHFHCIGTTCNATDFWDTKTGWIMKKELKITHPVESYWEEKLETLETHWRRMSDIIYYSQCDIWKLRKNNNKKYHLQCTSNKRPKGHCSHLSTIAFRLACQRVSS